MLKETGYQEKFELLRAWVGEVIGEVRKDLKNEHLRMDREFCKRHFLGKSPQVITLEEMVPAYQKEIAEGNVGLGEFIASRWLLKHTDIYQFFEENLTQLNPDFENIELLTVEQSETLIKRATQQFGSKKTYLFSILNSVVFPPSVYEELRVAAEQETHEQISEQKQVEEATTIEGLKKRHAREMNALTDRFEKKLSGLQRKYIKDMEVLKRQVGELQKKLTEAR